MGKKLQLRSVKTECNLHANDPVKLCFNKSVKEKFMLEIKKRGITCKSLLQCNKKIKKKKIIVNGTFKSVIIIKPKYFKL